MNLYPAMSGRMGRWSYYVVKMSMREVAESVQFAKEVYDDRTLDDAIQRVLNTSRVKKEIITYLSRQKDRFFSSIVVAALGGDPNWYPVEITDDPRFAMASGDTRLNNTFGVLTFDGSQDYYALDGQHRLAAIKALVDPSDPASDEAPDGFRDEEISVIVVVPDEADTPQEFLERYRRLFGNLNRYAKPMDQVTNIIMDEDDAFAIIARRLVANLPLLKAPGKESPRVKTVKGKNLRATDSYFTSLETLYSMNEALLHSSLRRNQGWEDPGGIGGAPEVKEFKPFRPSDEMLDELYHELTMYWTALEAEIPALSEDPTTMRVHDVDPEEDDSATDHLLFWPIGQDLLADVTRALLDRGLEDPAKPTPEAVRAALRGLGEIDWELHRPPWRYLILTQDPTGNWKMRSEDRTDAVRIARQVLEWQLGEERSEDELEELKTWWRGRLIPAQTDEAAEELWDEILEQRDQIADKVV